MASASLAMKRAPWNDEGWFAVPAQTLLTRGYMGSPIVHPRGTWLTGELTGIRTHTYWLMPGYLLFEAGWYRIFGFGIFQMRAIPVFSGLVVIWAWAFIVWRISRNRTAAWLTAALLALDITFLYTATDGRPDMTTFALGSLGLSAYLCLRERSLTLALFLANAFIGAAMYCHPNGMICAFLLALFVGCYDRHRLRWKDALSLTAYLVFAGAWLIYILDRPDYFLAQFRANAASPMVDRTSGIRHPLNGVVEEVTGRYLEHFGGSSVWAQLPRQTRIIPFLYWGCVTYLLCQAAARKNRGAALIGALAVATFLFMSVFVSRKGASYLVSIMPLYAACGALALRPEPGRFGRIPVVLLTALTVVNGLALVGALSRDAYRDGYLPVVSYLESHATRETPINGNPGLIFAMPDYRITDDSRLHDPADYIVVDRWYLFDWRFCHPTYEPATAVEVARKLTDYRTVFETNGWSILQRFPRVTAH